ncbi:hypothetical protein EDB84DRAFT_1441371 [Lactarius hengduanensis]|nr:hypothetical protein EDB84DRAFT_1441371 [Lactarius hengduanensis]
MAGSVARLGRCGWGGAAGVARLGRRGWGGAVGAARLGWCGWSGEVGVARSSGAVGVAQRRRGTGAGVDDGAVSRWRRCSGVEVGGAGGNLIAGGGSRVGAVEVSWPCRGGGVRVEGAAGGVVLRLRRSRYMLVRAGGPAQLK